METCRICGEETAKDYLCDDCAKRVEQKYEEWLHTPKKQKMKQCIICGGDMYRTHSYMVCSEKCRKAFRPVYLKVKYRRSKQREMARKSTTAEKKKNMKPLFPALDKQRRLQKKISNLGMCEREARAKGLSYGQYMALYRNPYRQKIF